MEQIDKFKPSGFFSFELYREGKLIDSWDSLNIVVEQARDYFLDAGLAQGAQLTALYLGIFSGVYTPLATDTAASIAGNSTESLDYTTSGTTRPIWTPDAVASQSIVNGAANAEFTINGTVTMQGAFLTSSSIAANDAGGTEKLIAASKFSAPRDLILNDVLKVQYTINATG